IQLNEYIVGIPIDEILDIAYVTSKIIADVPVALASVDEEYLIGTVKYGSGMLAILDLQKILLSPAVIVNQEV
ncbi:MAG: chemotaxis protein CheW, partial [Nitrospirae bacterium]|nr:chemotaxis protein CheW [Nitrospirota bacterium]